MTLMMPLADLEKLPVHPAAELFRKMTQEELLNLAESLAKVGMTDAITTYQGELLDGRNRLEAARIAGLAEVPVLEYQGDDPWALVIAKNLARRHLSKYDLVEVGWELREPYLGRVGGDWEQKRVLGLEVSGRTADLVASQLYHTIAGSTLEAGWLLMERHPEAWKDAKRTGEGIDAARRRATSPPTNMKNYTLKGALPTVTQGEELLRSVAAWRRSVGTNRTKMDDKQLAKVVKLAEAIRVHAEAILDTDVPNT